MCNVNRRFTRHESWKYKPWYMAVTAVAAPMGALPLAPVPSRKEASASPEVDDVCPATGPDVKPRSKEKVGVLKSVLFNRASSVIHPNFKLWEPCSFEKFACRLCVSRGAFSHRRLFRPV